MFWKECKVKYPDHYAKYKEHFANYFEHVRRNSGNTKSTGTNIHEFAMRGAGEVGNILTNNPFGRSNIGKKIFFLCVTSIKQLPDILHINPHLYATLAVVANWEFPADIACKRVAPGEQTTSSFHQIVLTDNSKWYEGLFYN
jgi:hypothetical protein